MYCVRVVTLIKSGASEPLSQVPACGNRCSHSRGAGKTPDRMPPTAGTVAGNRRTGARPDERTGSVSWDQSDWGCAARQPPSRPGGDGRGGFGDTETRRDRQAPRANAPLFRKGESGLCYFWRAKLRPVRRTRSSPLRREPRIRRAVGAWGSQALPTRAPDAGAVAPDGDPTAAERMRGSDGRGGNRNDAPVWDGAVTPGKGIGMRTQKLNTWSVALRVFGVLAMLVSWSALHGTVYAGPSAGPKVAVERHDDADSDSTGGD